MSSNTKTATSSEEPSVVMVGIEDNLAPHVRRELLNYPIDLAAEFPTTAIAADALREHRNKRHILVTHFQSAADEIGLRRLNSVLPGWPVIALVDIEPGADPENLFRANRSGAAQLVPLTLQPADFRAALDAVGVQFDLRSQTCETIVFSSVSGGCGGSTLATTTAHEIATQTNTKTVLIEVVSRMGTLTTNLNLKPRAELDEVLDMTDRLDLYLLQNALTPVGDNLLTLPSPTGLRQPGWIQPEQIAQVVDLARRLAGVVILDVHPTFDDLHFKLIDLADQTVLIAQQTIAAVRSLRLLLDNANRIRPGARTHLLLNMYDPTIQGLAVGDIERAMGVSDIFTVPRDTSAMLAAVNRGQPLRLVAPHSPALKAVGELVYAIRGHTRSDGSGLFARLFSAFRG